MTMLIFSVILDLFENQARGTRDTLTPRDTLKYSQILAQFASR